MPASEALFAEQYEYAHVGTNPSSTVAAESMLSAMIMKKLDDASDKDPNGLVSIPTDLAGIGQLTWVGKGYKTKWKRTQ